ncbi:MAG: hypothetical protein ACFE0J_22795 [Elainellaceae cyanobacterium]
MTSATIVSVMKLASIFISSALIVATTSVLLRVLMEPKVRIIPSTSSIEQINVPRGYSARSSAALLP